MTPKAQSLRFAGASEGIHPIHYIEGKAWGGTRFYGVLQGSDGKPLPDHTELKFVDAAGTTVYSLCKDEWPYPNRPNTFDRVVTITTPDATYYIVTNWPTRSKKRDADSKDFDMQPLTDADGQALKALFQKLENPEENGLTRQWNHTERIVHHIAKGSYSPIIPEAYRNMGYHMMDKEGYTFATLQRAFPDIPSKELKAILARLSEGQFPLLKCEGEQYTLTKAGAGMVAVGLLVRARTSLLPED